MNKSKISIIFMALILILVIIMLVNSVTSNVNHTVNQNNHSNNTTQYIVNHTYANNRLTFDYPEDWQQVNNLNNTNRWGIGVAMMAFNDPTDKNDDTYFYIKSRAVGSLEEQLNTYRSDIKEIGQTEVSERNITVNGMRAVELIKTWNNGDKKFLALTVHIEAVPGSVYYRIGCVTTADRFNATLPKFELVVNSFKFLI